ncbi:MAG: RND family transporter [Bacteroidales bacterium]|nr:RND family transporter [Bacteroidales bacterium]
MERFAQRIIKIKWLIVVIVLSLTVFFGYQIRNISIDSDVINSLNDNDPTALLYKNIGKQFGGNEIGMIVLETDDVFTAEVIGHVKQITDSVKFTAGISTVTSITDILDIKSSAWGIEIGKLLDEYDLPTERSELDSLRNYVFSKDMYRGAIVSEDGTATVILFNLLHDADKETVAKEIRQKTQAMNLSETLYYGGLPFLLNDVTDLMLSDMARLLPFAFIIIALFLFISFRSLRGVVLPLLIAGISVIWTLGLMAFTGYELTITSSYIPVVLLAVSTAYTIHVVNSYEINRLTNRKQALIQALTYTFIPVLLAAVTTMIGFVSFIFGSYLQMTRDFGIFTAIGTLFALLLSVFFVPALISALSVGGKKSETETREKKSILNPLILEPLLKIIIRHPKVTVAVWSILLLISIAGIFFMKTSVNLTSYFKADNPTRVTENLMQKKFGGSLPVYVVFEGDIQSPGLLKMMIRTEKFMKEDPNIAVTQSVADLVEQMNEAMGEGKAIPDEKAKIEQLWFLLDGQDIMAQLVSDDLDKAIIQSKFASIETAEIDAFTLKMNQYVQENSTDSCKIAFTGIPSIYYKLNASLIKSQYSSLIIAVILVLIIVGIILRSFSKGAFAAIPIVTTIIILLGFMGLTGIPLDIATVLVGSIALGIGIDYSIHVISGFNNHLKENGDAEKALESTIRISGKAVIINAASVAAGFLLLVFAQMLPIQRFGLLVAINMFGAGVGALTLLPAMLILANRKQKITA